MSAKYHHYLNNIFTKAAIGNLTIYTPEDKVLNFTGQQQENLSCDLYIKDWRMMDIVLRRGDIGLGEAYQQGMWESSNLSNFLTYCSFNLENISHQGDASKLNKFIFYLYNNLIRQNSKKGSKKNILDHYDIGNDFYQLWLDDTMTYSSGLLKSSNDNLVSAQKNKYSRIIDLLSLANKDVLEIGCGWGGFAAQASAAGANVTSITISAKQYQWARKKLNNKASIMLKDYREITGKYDNIVSIEMFEAVGEKYWPMYFNKIKQSLRQNGKALIQTITIKDEMFARYRKNSDYIRHCIFPGGMLASKERFCLEASRAKLGIGSILEFGHDYAWTLEQWYNNFMAIRDKLIADNYSPVFLRAWEFYLSFSIAGFNSGKTNVMQVELIN